MNPDDLARNPHHHDAIDMDIPTHKTLAQRSRSPSLTLESLNDSSSDDSYDAMGILLYSHRSRHHNIDATIPYAADSLIDEEVHDLFILRIAAVVALVVEVVAIVEAITYLHARLVALVRYVLIESADG